MSRSSWKNPYICKSYTQNTPKENNDVKIVSRSMVILPSFVEKTFNVHTGKTFNEVNVTEEMIGYKFGEFSFTRKRFIYKKKSK
jgi:small subunit ribosomal protein S19